MNDISIAILGAGNIARALIGGLLGRGLDPASIRAADPDAGARETVAREFGIRVSEDNGQVIAGADVVVVAVKPQVIDQVVTAAAPLIASTQLLISVAAGVPLTRIARALPPGQPIIRAMPNTPALIGAGISAMCANDDVNDAQRRLGEYILGAAGEVVWIEDESQMDTVTAVSGSGPAYFFLLIEALAAAGTRHGLPAATANRLALQTGAGACRMAAEADRGVDELRAGVTSPGGTTEAALQALEQGGFRDRIEQAVAAAVRRGRELGG